MKAFVMVNNYGGNGMAPLGWYFVADSAVSNIGKPFYLPDFAGETRVAVSFAIKISRLGKTVTPKFASRYYSEMAPAVHFRLPCLAGRLREEGLPTDASVSFDRSLMAAPFMPFDSSASLDLFLNSRKVSDFRFSSLTRSVDECISEISVLNTLKMGDLVLPGLDKGVALSEGDLLEIFQGPRKMFQVKIK